MEIAEIKRRLTLSDVIKYYGLKADRNNRINCPFHDDRTPSMQLYYKTHTAYCFSSNCKTHGKAMDVIDFVMHKEGCGKAEAINKCKAILGGDLGGEGDLKSNTGNISRLRYVPQLGREQFLGNMFIYFRNAVSNSGNAKDYLMKRGLDHKRIEVGYNGGQFHHGERKEASLIEQSLAVGLLLDKGLVNNRGGRAYSPFGKSCIVFALRNKGYEVTGLYFRSTTNDKDQRHYYLKDRSGLYPHYPKAETTKLILTESIIDAASLLQVKEITDSYGILACYGTNGLTAEHQAAISELQGLQEILFCFDNDEAGREGVMKYGKMLKAEYPDIKLTSITPIGKDINETLQAHSEEIFTELLNKRGEGDLEGEGDTELLFSSEEKPRSEAGSQIAQSTQTSLTPQNTSSMTLDFLKRKYLIKNLNARIGEAGIVGEEQSRMLLFLITISYLNRQPLHALVQGSSGSGKTHIISRIADLMPGEDVLRFTRITESSLYNWGEFDLYQKIIIIEDLDGLKEDALYALREFISNQVLRSSVTIKDKKGNNKSSHKIVKGQFSSLSATTKGETYEDNMSRSFLIAVDESKEQTQRIIEYQNKRNAGQIDGEQQQKAMYFIQQLVRHLKHYEVINPYATRLHLPEKVHKIRRLNEMYQAVIKQVTLLNQYQRKITKDDQLITQIEDIEQATQILFESIILKVDELDGSLRQFFERLKKHVKNEHQEFILRDIRQELGVSKTQVFRYMQLLTELEYIRQTGGYANKGIKYRISYWDNYAKLRAEIKDFLMKQIEQLKREL